MAKSAIGRWTLMGVALVMAGCAQGVGTTENGAEAPSGVAAAGARDVEAPEVFAADADGLWDGRPSLGGVWVAHPSVSGPQRVTVQNKSNGRTITSALFRRERDIPGPAFQVSSDAAKELGLLAGQPTPLHVVAIKRAEPAAAPTAAAPAAPAAAAAVAGAATQPGSTPPPPAPGGAAAPRAGAATLAADTQAALGATVAPAPVAEDAPPSSFGGGRSKADTAEPQPVPEDRPPTSFGRRQPRAEPATGTASAQGDISVAPLDSAPPAAAAAAPAAVAPAPAQAAAPVQRPFIQAAIFGTEANAETAAAALKKGGLAATIRKTTSNGTTYWRVLIGPAASAADQSTLLEKTRALGYPDAFPVRG